MKKIFLSFVCLILAVSFGLSSVMDNKTMMKRLVPLAGKWHTTSISQKTGFKAPGELEYRFVLGEDWMFVEFIGKHPKRKVWQAYVMIKYDIGKKCYVSWDFFNKNDPVLMTGEWIKENTLRFKSEHEGILSGIDYFVKEDKTIYQENWVIDKEKNHTITLKTYYKRRN